MSAKGMLGTKLGMTQVFGEDNAIIPVTVVQAGPCTVTQVKTNETDGYSAVQLAYGDRKAKNVNKPMKGHLAKAGIESAKALAEVRLATDDGLPALGTTIGVNIFHEGDPVDVTGTSKGKGWAGVMKRHNFSGMGDGHGVKKKNRHPGSIGMCATPGRTFKGTRMAGRMGGERVTVQNLEIVGVDTKNQLLLVRGAIPGPNGSIVFIKSAVKAGPVEDPFGLVAAAEAKAEAEAAAVEAQAAEEPAAEEPAAEEPVAEEPVAEEPAAETADEPAAVAAAEESGDESDDKDGEA
jgi:large subunit ribosomal protein L3